MNSRFGYDWRENKYHSIAPPERGVNGLVDTSIAFVYESAEAAAAICDGGEGYGYPRVGSKTPAVHQLEEALVDLELGAKCSWRKQYKAAVYPSGMNAIFNAILNLADCGHSIVSSPYLYGSTYHLFTQILPRLGIECVMIDDPLNMDSWLEGIYRAKSPVCLFAEDNANPMLLKLNNREIARLAHYHKLFYVCDMTVTTPFLEQPMVVSNVSERVDVVIHALSKCLNGYSNCLGGSVIACREMFERTDEFAGLGEYFTCGGGVMDPRVADVILHNLAGAKERVLEKAANAILVAGWLREHPKVEKIYGPGCDLLSFQIKGGLEEARRVVEGYELILFATHLGDIQSISTHPASTTHGKVPEEEKQKMGVTDNLIRLSVGLEEVDDICNDLNQALGKI